MLFVWSVRKNSRLTSILGLGDGLISWAFCLISLLKLSNYWVIFSILILSFSSLIYSVSYCTTFIVFTRGSFINSWKVFLAPWRSFSPLYLLCYLTTRGSASKLNLVWYFFRSYFDIHSNPEATPTPVNPSVPWQYHSRSTMNFSYKPSITSWIEPPRSTLFASTRSGNPFISGSSKILIRSSK